LAPGPRIATPGIAPVCSPPAITGTPFTRTCRTPAAYYLGRSNELVSPIFTGSNATTSAAPASPSLYLVFIQVA
jgi:hypothetical protein